MNLNVNNQIEEFNQQLNSIEKAIHNENIHLEPVVLFQMNKRYREIKDNIKKLQNEKY